jgi:hypothetical protein
MTALSSRAQSLQFFRSKKLSQDPSTYIFAMKPQLPTVLAILGLSDIAAPAPALDVAEFANINGTTIGEHFSRDLDSKMKREDCGVRMT